MALKRLNVCLDCECIDLLEESKERYGISYSEQVRVALLERKFNRSFKRKVRRLAKTRTGRPPKKCVIKRSAQEEL